MHQHIDTEMHYFLPQFKKKQQKTNEKKSTIFGTKELKAEI